MIWTEEVYARLYPNGYAHGIISELDYEVRADRLMALGAQPGASVLVVGCGFGFLNEELEERGFATFGIDPSPWIAGRWEAQAQPGLGFEAADVRDFVPLNGRYDWVVFDDLDPGYHDPAETRELAKVGSRLGRRVVHFVTPAERGDELLCWRSLDEWRSIFPGHAWLTTVVG